MIQDPGTRTELYGRYSLRPAQAADLDSLIELLLALQDQIEMSNPDLWRMKPGARHNLKGQIGARLKTANTCALVAEHEEDGIIGMIFGRIVVNNRYTPSRAGQVDQAFVSADHRRARFFASEDVEDITLRYVVGNEEAAAFWSALGFSPRIITAGAGREALEHRLP